MYSDTSCLTRINTINAGLARMCAHITHRHARAYITQAESGRERETERRQRRICQSRRDTSAHSHITASPITALPAPADWSEVKVILFRTAKQCVTLQHDSLSGGRDRLAVLFHCSNTTLLPLLILRLAGIYICVCNVISCFCFSTHHAVCSDQWDGISDELWKDFCASFTFIPFLPPKMDFFNLDKAKVIVFCTSSAIFLVPLAAFGGEQLNSRTDRVSNIASK